jgi:rhodanese-related sulfurtransferase
LARIGFDRMVGVVIDLTGYDQLGSYRLASITDLVAELRLRSPQLLDVREPGEWATGSIPHSIHSYVPDLRDELPGALDSERPVWVICGGGYRSQMAVRYLEEGGILPIVVVGGGVEDVLGTPSV